MRNRIDIDHVYSRAIVREIGEKLRTSLNPDPELPPSIKMKIDRLRELEGRHHQSFPISSIRKTCAVEVEDGFVE